MKWLAKKLTSALLGPMPVSRDRALGVSERLSAGTSLTASLEYLASRENLRSGGLNDWSIMRGATVKSSRPTRAVLELVSDEKTTTVLHVARVAAALGLMAPGSGRWRGATNVFLGVSNALLYPRHRLGTDGSDQVTSLVQPVVGLARLSRTPQVQDALMWYVALQGTLSYLVSGWVKLLGRPWRRGEALSGIMRTKTYGHRWVWAFAQRHPRVSRGITYGTLTLECLFPLAYLRGGALARPFMVSAASFHVANGFVMGLGRFVTAFVSMHPMIAYTSTPRSHPAAAGRDDRALVAVSVLATGAAAGAGVLAGVRRIRATDASPASRTAKTRHGNELNYDARLSGDHSTPVLVFLTGMVASPEHFGWITETLLRETDYDLLTYSRAGYGASKRYSKQRFTLQESVDDLIDLLDTALPGDRDVVLVGHSLGGELARRASVAMENRVRGVAYVDSSHPAELRRSEQQNESAEKISEGMRLFADSLRLGLGVMLKRPEWIDNLPAQYRRRLFAQYADSRLWTTGMREWKAAECEFREHDDDLPRIGAHAMVISAQQTVDRDPQQLLMHNDLADAHRGADTVVKKLVVERADHDSVLTQARQAIEVGRRIQAFVDEISRYGSGAVPTAEEER